MIYQTGVSFKELGIKNLGRAITDINRSISNLKNKNFVPLITCNRAEIYFDKSIRSNGYKIRRDKEALRHLFRVASGIDSMIIGENEIALQVKNAFVTAIKENHCSGELALAFDRALKLAKKVRSETKINYGKTSIPSIAVDFIIKKHNPKNVLIIGSGMLGGKIAKALSRKNIDEIIVSNRHYKRAKKLAEKVNGKAAKLDNIKKLLNKTNAVFSTTACPVPVLYKKDIPKNKKLIIVDLAIPRDVDKSIDKMKNVKVIRFEYFKKIINENKKRKRGEVKKIEKMIDDEIERFRRTRKRS